MKILNASQIRLADSYTIEHEPIASIDLMERAASTCVNWITQHYSADTVFHIVCGLGNNGGDGLAIARLLHTLEYMVECSIVHYSNSNSTDFQTNLSRLKKTKVQINDIKTKEDLPKSRTTKVVLIDALLGTGISGAARGLVKEIIDKINSLKVSVASIDIPSGLQPDCLDASKLGSVINASQTLSFEVPKLSFLLPSTGKSVGELTILPIGLNQVFIEGCESSYFFNNKIEIAAILKKRPKFSHKGTFGHSLIIAGSYGKVGAATLAGRACLNSGVGKLTFHSPKCANSILQISVPEGMINDNPGQYTLEITEIEQIYSSLAIGPGIGTDARTEEFIHRFINTIEQPVIWDADALNILAKKPDWLSKISTNSILSPHPKEFERLVGKWENEQDKIDKLLAFSSKYSVYLVLKGAYTAIAEPEGRIYFNNSGNPGMATAGSGDVLTGVLAGLLAQGYSPRETCHLGVYLHGLAGDLAKEKLSEESLIASDIVSHLSEAFLELQDIS